MAEAVALEEKKQKQGIGEFVRETRAELDKTTFPSSDDVKKTTIIVVVSVLFFAAYLFVVDHAWTYAIDGLTWVINKIAGV